MGLVKCVHASGCSIGNASNHSQTFSDLHMYTMHGLNIDFTKITTYSQAQ